MTTRSHLVGQKGTPYRFVVEEGKVAEFVRAVHATEPLFSDREAAAAEGLSGVLAPPTFSVASSHWAVPGAVPDLQLDLRGVLAGGNEWEYLLPVVAGDELLATTEVESVTTKQSGRGPMTVIGLKTEFTRSETLVQVYRSTILQFAAKDEEAADGE